MTMNAQLLHGANGANKWRMGGLRMCILTDVSKITIYFEITKIETISGETTPGVCIHLDEH